MSYLPHFIKFLLDGCLPPGEGIYCVFSSLVSMMVTGSIWVTG